jgi:serine/threonine-protein kinase
VPRALVAWIGGEVLRALEHAHGQGVVHRDVSPHNVLVARTGAVKLSDFGIAKLESSECSGTVKGKIAYLSPEQAAGQPVDRRSDLFSLGVVLYELLTGARPFRGGTDAEVMASVIGGRMAPLPAGDLERVVTRMLARDRGQRFASAADALRALVATACFPKAGMDDLASFLVEVERMPTKEQTAPVALAEGTRSEQESDTIRISWRLLRALALVAVAMVVVAVFAWSAPKRADVRAQLGTSPATAQVVAKVTTHARLHAPRR